MPLDYYNDIAVESHAHGWLADLSQISNVMDDQNLHWSWNDDSQGEELFSLIVRSSIFNRWWCFVLWLCMSIICIWLGTWYTCVGPMQLVTTCSHWHAILSSIEAWVTIGNAAQQVEIVNNYNLHLVFISELLLRLEEEHLDNHFVSANMQVPC